MSWWGKLVGGAFGYLLGGPLGAVLGGALGHQFDRGLASVGAGPRADDRERVQAAFFTATFSVMGHLAKTDGRVSEDEIRVARQVMDHLRLDADQRQLAIQLFTEGKQPHFALDPVLDQFRRECRRRQVLIQMFLEIQLQAAFADGALHPSERHMLLHVCDRLGYPRRLFERLESMLAAERTYRYRAEPGTPERSLADAYRILGVPATASDAEVKKAYRRLMSQHHPDKLVAKGLPEEMLRVATEKTQEIKAAYEQVKGDRGQK